MISPNDRPLAVFLSYYKPHWKLFAGDLACAVLIAAIDVGFPVVSRFALNSLIPNRSVRAFCLLLAALLAAYLLRRMCTWFVNYWGHVFGTLVEADMRRDVFEHLERQSFSFYDRHRTGKLMARATTDLFEITELAHHGPEDVLISALTLLGSFCILLKIRWELAAIVFAFLPLTLAATLLSRKKLSAASRTVKEATAEINAVLESSISGVRVTKIFTNEAYEMRRFAEGNGGFLRAKKSFYKNMAGFHADIELFSALLNVLVLAAGGFFIMKGRMTVPDLVAANLFVAAFSSPVRRLVSFVEQYTTGMAGFRRFLELMRSDTGVRDAPGAREILCARGNIAFEDVCFSYNEGQSVLEGVSLRISAGQKFALVGLSGGGKTTLCSLIPRFYEISSGRILLDGIDVRDITLESLRRQIGMVQQDVFLFAGTVRENIAYGRIGATDAEVEDAARRAEIHDDILKMPGGYDAVVGERGITLSGGQKQRVSIARCFLKNPPILILDEATSALDTATEIKIQRAFDALSKGRTTLIIAHRLSTIQNADCIAVVGDKGIVEQGTHGELLARDGAYASLYRAFEGAR
ncbi:MAG: ABC transporter ATP-binding protein/permease [Treponemataceae bacterium]|nr:ABC transporter ATP-binding protein/permease [Treponemataceae bacterium]